MNPLATIATPVAPVVQAATDHIRAHGGINQLLDIPQLKVQRDIVNKLQAMLDMDHLVLQDGCKIASALLQVASMYRGERGMSPSHIGKYWAIWSKGGQKPNCPHSVVYSPHDWRMFIPNYTNGDTQPAIRNPELRRFVLQLFGDTSRWDASGNALCARIMDMWFDGQEIPGVGTIYEWCMARGRPVPSGHLRRNTDIPDGLSPRNILRMLPGRTRRVYIQRGEHAAHDHWGDQLLRDRSKLMPFQLVTFDDVRFDIQVLMPLPNGTVQAVYPQAIFALDVATGVILAKGVMGSYTRESDSDGGFAGTKRGFQQADMRWLVTSILEKYGLPQDWQMKLLLENASASLSEPDKKVFESITGIEIENTGLVRNKLFKSGFREEGGMPWQKGWIEACFRLLHTRINHLPGTVGSRYALTKGTVAQEVRYNLQIAEEACRRGIPMSELRFSVLTLEQFHDLLDQYVLRLNFRTAHTLQGFSKVFEYEVAPGEYIRHNDPQASSVIPVGATLTPRMEAPIERAVRLMQGHRMRQVHPRELIVLALDKRPVTVRGDKVSFIARHISNDPIIFRDPEHADILEKYSGQEKALMGFLSHDASCIHLFTNDENMVYVGSPRNQQRVDITDETAILCNAGRVDRGRQRIRDEVAEEVFGAREAEYAAMREHNARVLGTDRQEPTIADTIEAAETIARASSVRSRKTRQASPSLDASALLDDDDADREAHTAPYTTAPSFNGEDLL